MRAFFSQENSSLVGYFTTRYAVMAPAWAKKIAVKGVAFGGKGGNSASTVGGGGGGAGEPINREFDIKPNSMIYVGFEHTGAKWTGVNITYVHRNSTTKRIINLRSGDDGGNASGTTAGTGGDSGGGGEGGTLTNLDTRIGTGFDDGEGGAHTTGGQAGWGASLPSTLKPDFSYEKLASGPGRRIKNRWPNLPAGDLTIGAGGRGGVSYFGPPGGFGSGGIGADAGQANSTIGGDAFIEIEFF